MSTERGKPMATMITNAALVAAGKRKLESVKTAPISYAQMDCQALVEALLIECGVPEKECNLSGRNAHWRKCVWRGSPEECVKQFGCVPGGAGVFIVEEQSDSTPAKYRGDGMKDATHMGVYLGGSSTINSSEKNGGVCESTKFNGKKSVPNGGWNSIGLFPWVDYCLSSEQQEALTESTDSETDADVTSAAVDVTAFYTVKRGCKGGAVRRLQTWLLDLGYDLGTYGSDGDFGAATDTAVKAFQQAKGLSVDGIVGQKTWAALAEAREVAASANAGE